MKRFTSTCADPNAPPDRQRRRRLWLAALASGALVACSGISEPPETFTAQAALQPADGVADPVTGSVALVIEARQTQIGIGVRGGVPEGVLGWAVRNGSCSGTGQRVGPASAFPPVEIDSIGEGETETVIFRRIDVEERYAAEVFDQPDGTGTVQACADLIPAG